MKIRNNIWLMVILFAILVLTMSCAKNISNAGLYIPTVADVTANATLEELQQGRSFYISYCNKCHSLVSPESYTPQAWKSILANMAPRTNLSAAQIQLVTKYLCKGNQ